MSKPQMSNRRLRGSLSLAQPSAAAWTQIYGYDEFGRLTNTTSAAGVFAYNYQGSGAFDLVYSLMYPSGAHSDRAYDGVGRLTTIALKDPLANVLDQYDYSYDLGSQRTQQVFSANNSINLASYSHYTDYAYDSIGQLKRASGWEPNDQGGQTPRLHEQFGYAYDAAWNLNYRTNNALVQSFGVNNLNELTTGGRSGTLTVAGTAGERRIRYEGDSGVTNVTVSGTGLASGAAELYADGTWARAGATPANGQNSYTATAQDTYGRTSQDTASVNLPSTVSFSYDGNGNLLNDGRRYFEYDSENQLTNVYVSGQWRSEFAYDGLMRRKLRKEYTWSGSAWVKTNEVRYIYDARVVVQERDVNNLALVSYTRGKDLSGSSQGAGGIGGLLARTAPSTFNPQLSTAFYHCDGNGNITCLINASNAVVAQYAYDPYGSMLAMGGPLASANLYRFSSKESHPNSGLAYYLYRHYDPNLQRWLIRDPLHEQGDINLYEFAFSGPTTWLDPSGERCWNPFNPEFWAYVFGGDKIPPPPDPNSNRALLNDEGVTPGTFADEDGSEITGGKCTALVCGAVAAGVLTAITDGLGNAGKTEELGIGAMRARKSAKAGLSAKEAAKDIPSWALGQRPFVGENGKQFAKRLMDKKYGPGNYNTGPGYEFSKLKKYCDRAFE